MDELAGAFALVSLAEAVAATFPRRDVSDDDARRLAHGQRLTLADLPGCPVGVFAPDGSVVALVQARDGVAKPLVVFR
jgi:tRNA pseudouridine55 synthase